MGKLPIDFSAEVPVFIGADGSVAMGSLTLDGDYIHVWVDSEGAIVSAANIGRGEYWMYLVGGPFADWITLFEKVYKEEHQYGNI